MLWIDDNFEIFWLLNSGLTFRSGQHDVSCLYQRFCWAGRWLRYRNLLAFLICLSETAGFPTSNRRHPRDVPHHLLNEECRPPTSTILRHWVVLSSFQRNAFPQSLIAIINDTDFYTCTIIRLMHQSPSCCCRSLGVRLQYDASPEMMIIAELATLHSTSFMEFYSDTFAHNLRRFYPTFIKPEGGNWWSIYMSSSRNQTVCGLPPELWLVLKMHQAAGTSSWLHKMQ